MDMTEQAQTEMLRNIDARVTRIEQYLPGLSTREELHAAIATAIAPLATREELQAAIAPLATREELHAAIATAIAPLATREELQAAIAPLATREELEAEGERARRHATMLFEDLRDDVRIVLEHLVALSARVDTLAQR